MVERIEEIAERMVADGRGILAADESTGTIKKRFDSISVESTQESRRDYREMLFGTTDAMKECISGVILFDETIRQSARDGTPFVEMLNATNSIPGIKVDKGAKDQPGFDRETVTEGLDGLPARMKEYYEMGARFAKWRGVIGISDDLPNWGNVRANAHALARYAAICQQANIVPIVEPECLMDGEPGDHSLARCADVTGSVLDTVFNELHEARVNLEGMILKPNMVIDGSKRRQSGRGASVEEVAEATVTVLKAHVPHAVPGIAFLSGGQSDIEATAHLNAMNANYSTPFALTFSYGRALQAAALDAWRGADENWEAARAAFAHRARMNRLAALGQWSEEEEGQRKAA